MVEAIEGQRSTSELTLLNVKSFGEALTKDVRLYDVRNEVKPITNFDAARGVQEAWQTFKTTPISRQSVAEGKEEAHSLVGEGIQQGYTFSSIDITAATYKSRDLAIALWTTILITYFA